MARMRKGPLAVLLVALVSMAVMPTRGAAAPAARTSVPGPEPVAVRQDRVQEPKSGGEGDVRLLSSSGDAVIFDIAVPWDKLNLEPVTVAGQSYVRASLPGWATTTRPGAPELPQLAQAIGVPFGVSLRVRVRPGAAHTQALPVPVIPVTQQLAQGERVPADDGTLALPVPASHMEEDSAIYGGREPYPGTLAEIATEGVIRQQRVAAIRAFPVQYQPLTREITIYESLQVEIRFEGRAAETHSEPESAAFEAVLSQLLNYESAQAWRIKAESAGDQASPWAPPVPGWRVKVRTDGIYKLTYSEMQAAGLPVDTLDPTTFQVFCLGQQVAIHVVGEGDGHFDQGDYILFYGQAVHSKYTRDNVYWLTYGHATGMRMSARDGTPNSGTTPDYFGATRHMEQNVYYLPGMPGDEDLERWTWDYVYPPSRPSWTYTFSLAAPYAGGYTATLRVAMLGYLDNAINPDHHTQLYVNGTLVEDAWWDGMTWRIAEVTFPQNLLVAGNNTISLVCPNDTGVGIDVVYVDWAELVFGDTFTATSNRLPFPYGTAGTWKYRVEGFTTDSVSAFDVTLPGAVVRIEGVGVTPSGAGYAAQFRDEVAAHTEYITLGSNAFSTVQAIEADTASVLQSPDNGADYLLVTHADFGAPAASLRDWRTAQGLRTELIDVQDVYDEFGYGIVGARAIHDFVAYAYENWQAPAPSFVALVGDGHYDPNNYKNYGRTSYMPPYLAPVDPWLNETAADNRFVTVAGADTFPDLMMGRLSVNSVAEATALVTKIIAYEESPEPGDWNQKILAVADNADTGGDFALMSDELLSAYLPAPYTPEKVYYGITHTTPSDARAAIQAAINSGKLIVNYIGHASPTLWASEGLLKTSDVPLLTNGGKLPVMLPMTCYDGYYHLPFTQQAGQDALGEVITRADGRGAVASWSPTGLGVATGHDNLDRGFFEAVFLDGVRQLGEATIQGKLALWATGSNLDLLDTYLLFGDPAMEINALEIGADLQVIKSVEPAGPVVPGNSVVYTLTFANNGPATAHGVVLTDPIPAQLANPKVIYMSPEVIGVIPGTTFAWQVADLPAGATGSVQVRGTIGLQTPPGTIVNEATIAGSSPDPVPDNNTASVSNTVQPVMRVASIVLKYTQPAPGRYSLSAQVRITDLLRVPVAGATVQGQWTFPNGSTTNQQGVTDLLGRVNLRTKSNQSGSHKLCVTGVTKTGVVYLPNRNMETCDTVIIP